MLNASRLHLNDRGTTRLVNKSLKMFSIFNFSKETADRKIRDQLNKSNDSLRIKTATVLDVI